MVFELTLGNVITVLALFVAALWALMKVISGQQERRLAERFDALGKTMESMLSAQRDTDKATQQLEREFRKHQADAARDYVLREDFVRHIGIIEARIDNFALRMERYLEQILKGGNK